MFTGLVQAVGKIQRHAQGVLIEVPNSFPDLNLGDSIAVDGVCLTVCALRNTAFLANISEETLKKTVLGYKADERGIVNLELALRLCDRLGGHLVSGHVDGLGKVISIQALSNSWHLKIKWEDFTFSKYTCDKASISLNGISLTVAESKFDQGTFSIAVIPHTWENTSLKYLKEGELINLEADLMAKYAESLLGERLIDKKKNSQVENSNLSEDWLINNGFG
ncbi:riboflavin synthase [Prochlorococcus marinus]|uniref:riboflavin synthase n=1 Tax=Prochlorococcus marinus TaxID=1219 RepID=UPI0022B3ACDA|nr:riboflavin synthase [Prochlorococcus marinus]